MIQDILRRLVGTTSYENGVITNTFCKLISQGKDQPISVIPRTMELDAEYPDSPIVAINLKRKLKIPYESEYEFSFNLNYKNQNGDTRIAQCTIKEYADANIDFRIFMQDPTDMVREILSIEPRVDIRPADLDHLVNNDILNDDYNNVFGTGEHASGMGWNWHPDRYEVTPVESGSITKFNILTKQASAHGDFPIIPITDYFFQQKGKLKEIIERRVIAQDTSFHQPKEKLWKFKVNIGMTSTYQSLAIIQQTSKGSFTKFFTTNSTTHTNNVNNGIASELVPVVTGDTTNEYEILVSEMTPVQFGTLNFNIPILYTQFSDVPDATTITYNIGKTEYYHYSGNEGDEVDIVGLVGNVARLQGIYALGLSDIAYNAKIVNLQKYVETCFSGGMKQQLNQYGINVSQDVDIEVRRLYLRLFSTFIAPNAINMQESMNSIIKIIDPLGSVNVYPEYSDSYYKLIVDFNITFTDFTEDGIDLLLLFANRYRPIPADLDVNIGFTYESEAEVEESASLVVNGTATLMSPSTQMSPSTLMTTGFPVTFTLPTDYP